jgi:hypothetical protein
MKKLLWLLIFVLLVAAPLVACDDDDDDDNNDATDDDAVDDDDNDDDDASPPPPLVGQYEFALKLEVDFDATLRTKVFADETLEAVLTPASSFDVLTAGTALRGTGKVLHFPESGWNIVTLKLDGAAVPGGKCGNQAMSYSVSLTVKDGNAYHVGGLTAYCGANTFTGRSARVMRLSGFPKAVE